MLAKTERPPFFNEVVGQDNIIKDLQNHLKAGELPSVMIFSGETGVGKTTIAFLIAKLMNCSNKRKVGDFYEPCNECSACQDINNQKFFRDVTYFNCGTKNKDSILSLEQKLNRTNKRDKYKIIILDEAQNFGNAQTKATLLDFLEKERKGVYIIACTMEAKKLHKAIKDRGVFYNFKPIDSEVIAKKLFDYLKERNFLINNIKIPEEFIESLFTIANNCGNSMRGAWGIFERCIHGQLWKKEDIIENLDIIDIKTLNDINIKLKKKDSSSISDLMNIQDLQEFYFKSRSFLIKFYAWKINNKINSYEKWYLPYFNAFAENGLENYYSLTSVYSKYNNHTFDSKGFLLDLINYMGGV
jgi:DNA polymerase-3 subunit gamma/tau